MTRPNLFDYATSELSQDAFICWSLQWLNQTDSSEMREYAFNFSRLLLSKHGIDLKQDSIIQSLDIKRQYEKIDIFINFRTQDTNYYLIIEDKTLTSTHSNQLKKYFSLVKNKTKNDPLAKVLGIYYKTGFVYGNERRHIEALHAEDIHYQIIERKEIINLLAKHQRVAKNDILTDHYLYLSEKQEKEEQLLRLLTSPDIEEQKKGLTTQRGQWVFFENLFKDFHHIILDKGTSYGKPWTNCSFLQHLTANEFPDALFYRVDKRGDRIYLSVRQYLNYDRKRVREELGEDVQAIKQNKNKRLKELVQIFNETLAEMENKSHALIPGKRSNDNSGFKESEIGVFFLNEHNTIEKFYRLIPDFHILFTEKINKRFSLTVENESSAGNKPATRS